MILAILQARTSSRRLPNKVMMPILGQPMLARQIERLARARRFDRLVLATSSGSDDDCLEVLSREASINCFRGSLDDVLDRFYRAAAEYHPTWVVRVTGDCPLADWGVIDRCIDFAVDGDFDYASNTLRPTWPDGLDVEICKFAALETAFQEAATPVQREHVMPFLTRQPDRFRLGSFENDTDLSALRWTVDEPQDFNFVQTVYERLYPRNPAFDTAEILDLLAHDASLSELNTGFERNAALLEQLSNK